VEYGAHLPLIDFGEGSPTLDELTAYAATTERLGFRFLCTNDHLVVGRPWLDGPTALAAVLAASGGMRLASTPTTRWADESTRGADTGYSSASLDGHRSLLVFAAWRRTSERASFRAALYDGGTRAPRRCSSPRRTATRAQGSAVGAAAKMPAWLSALRPASRPRGGTDGGASRTTVQEPRGTGRSAGSEIWLRARSSAA
jgi:hypothetical protein